MKIQQLKSTSSGVSRIIEDIDDLMLSIYPDFNDVSLSLEDLSKPSVYFVGVYIGDDLAACGAIVSKLHDVQYGELKRIYVKPEYRGQGISKRILEHFIEYANSHSFNCIRLETGFELSTAVRLYESLGFIFREVFGDYEHDVDSVYMELCLEQGST